MVQEGILIIPKGQDESQTFKISNVAYNMFIPTTSDEFHRMMHAIAALEIDEWDNEKYSDFVEKHAGVDTDYDNNWMCTLQEGKDWRYDNNPMKEKTNGYVFEHLNAIVETMTALREQKAEIEACDWEVWANKIHGR